MEEPVMPFQLPDADTPSGERVRRRLRDEFVIWLTTVNAQGMPQPTVVWFLWEPETMSFLVYSRSNAKRLEHIQQNPRVALNLDGDHTGGDLIVFTGEARLSSDTPPVDQQPAYVAKYDDYIRNRLQTTPQQFAVRYPIALHISPRGLRIV